MIGRAGETPPGFRSISRGPAKHFEIEGDMATYKEIQFWVKQTYGFVPETCWIADDKNQCGLLMREAPNRKGETRVKPCPPEKIEAIRAALLHFGMIKGK